ncbi:hypothetical protein BC827DRAFT_342361 [Russula dissimulans]|nr:hypothetical protein BC827DRAFT_342361 [Russula dissimulans]
MRAYVTLAQTLLITSLVNSAFAVPAPAPQVHDKRLYSSGPSGAIIGETGEATTGGYGQVVKENALAGILSGLAAAIASVGQLKLYAHIKNSTRRGLDDVVPVFPLKDLASHTGRPASRSALTDLSDKDLLWLSGITRRTIEALD